jgi:valyl-tRNA synthetase
VRVAAESSERVRAVESFIKAMAKVGEVEVLGDGPRPSGEPSAVVVGLGEVFVSLRGVVEPAEVRARLERDLAKVEKELVGVEGKLGRPDFVGKAPVDVVEKERQRAAALQERRAVLGKHLATLGAA